MRKVISEKLVFVSGLTIILVCPLSPGEKFGIVGKYGEWKEESDGRWGFSRVRGLSRMEEVPIENAVRI